MIYLYYCKNNLSITPSGILRIQVQHHDHIQVHPFNSGADHRSGWMHWRGHLLCCPKTAAANANAIAREPGKKKKYPMKNVFLKDNENRQFLEPLEFEVVEPGYKTPMTTAQIQPIPEAPPRAIR